MKTLRFENATSMKPEVDLSVAEGAPLISPSSVHQNRYECLRYSQFFPAESAWWRLPDTLGF